MHPFSDKWNRHFLDLSLAHAAMSKDPAKKVGSVIVGPDKEIISMGFNGLPRGLDDTDVRLNDKEVKRLLTVHAEMNAVLAMARAGGAGLLGKTMFIATHDDGGVWGGPPCTRCAVEVIQAGIAHIVSYPAKPGSSWASDLGVAMKLLTEVGISYTEVTK